MPKDPKNKIVSLSEVKSACENCSLQQLCLPIGIDEADLDQLEQIIKRPRPLKRGEHMVRQGDPFKSLFAVRSGSVKSYTIMDDGSEQITGMQLSGEMLGLDAINEDQHPCSIKALETTSYCEIPFDRLEDLSGTLPSLRRQLLRILSKEILHDEELLLLLGKKTAEERLATLLISLSDRYKERGFSATEFHLSMSRNDIGNYLGLAVETVSRLFSRFQDQGLLEVEGKLIKLLKLEEIKKISGCKHQLNQGDKTA